MSGPRFHTSRTPLLAVAGTIAFVLLVALISAIGIVGVILLSGVLGSVAVVVLTVLRRRPVAID